MRNSYSNGYNRYYYRTNQRKYPNVEPDNYKNKVIYINLLFISVVLIGYVVFFRNDIKVIKSKTPDTGSYVQDNNSNQVVDENVPLVATLEPTLESTPEQTVLPTVQPIVEPTIQPVQNTTTPEVIDSLKSYYNQNNDLIGWLSISGTPIDNPVMFTPEDETYYLDKDFNGNYLLSGTLLIGAQSRVGEPNSNIIIYGHNMKDQTMFGSLKLYAKESYFNSHKNITFNTLYEEATYEVIAAFYAKVLKKSDTSFKYYQATNFENESEYNDFITNISKMRLYDTGVLTEYGDQFITLSTCSYHTENGRFVVVARKIK